ncbi:MAG: class I SAM-dependent methyltransferase [Acidimicrobiales bacterium]
MPAVCAGLVDYRQAMRSGGGFRERLFACWYPVVAGLSERAGQDETRRRLVGQASGRTLEIGAGNGYNLAHYPASVTELVVTDPSAPMLSHLERRLEEAPPPVGTWALVGASGEDLPFPAASLDTVVATFVHCTIPGPAAALAQIARVLRPGGRYLFLEHVRAPQGSALGAFQDLVERPHRYAAGGCHPNRRTDALIRASALRVETLVHGSQPRSLPSVRPTIIGTAIRGG